MNISKNINKFPVKKTFSRLKQTLILVLLVMAGSTSLQATHIVGADISYQCLGWSDYEVTLTVRIDCENGEEPFDNIAHVGIFDGYGNLLPFFGTGGMILIKDPQIDTINTDLDTGCAVIGEQVCVVQAIYKGVVNLPKRTSGYYFAYQRCCRNVTLTNVVDPLNSGSTVWVRLPENTMGTEACNSTPTFDEWANIYECVNSTLDFSHSATDADGDSLVYSLCAPSDGASFDLPLPVPPDGPDWADVEFKLPFSFTDPMGGTPLTINPETGQLSAVPASIGQFLIGVCVTEYRDGVELSTVRRFFEYNIRACAAGPIALFDVDSLNCDGLDVNVNNTSTDADSYVWTVEPSTGVVFDANAENPVFTFPANGPYTITLEAFRDIDGCSSTFSQDIGVYDSNLEASFTAEIESCVTDSTNIVLTSTSTDPDFPIESWIWTVTSTGFSATLSGEEVTVTVPTVDEISITLLVTSENGCPATATGSFDADPLDLMILANPMAICAGDTIAILVDPNCDLTYTITPLDFVIFDDPDDPCVISISPTETVVYTVTVTDGICTASEEFSIEVIDKADLSIAGDSISCDGQISLSVLGGLPGNQFEWSTNSDFNPLIGDMTDILNYMMVGDSETIYVRVKDGTGCSNIASFNIYNQTIDISYPPSITLCTGSQEEIIIINNDLDQDLTIVFDPNDIIISTTDSSVIISTEDPDLVTSIDFTVTNQFGCTEMGSVNVDAEQLPELAFTFDVTCGTFEMCFTNTSTPNDGEFMWDFGDEATLADTSLLADPCYTYPAAGMYEVTLTINGGACEGVSLTQTVEVPSMPEIEIDSEDLALCLNENITLTAITDTEGDIVWTDDNGEIGTGITIDYTATGDTKITVTITDSFDCTAMDMIMLDVYIFDASVNVPEISCVDEEVAVSVTNNSEGGPFTYDWEPGACIVSGEGTPEVIIASAETKSMSVLITNTSNGCDTLLTFDFNVSVINKVIRVDPEEAPFQCQEIEVYVDPDNDDCTYLWATGETTSSIFDTILQTTTYTVTITDLNGCTLEQSITVDPLLPECDESDVYVPNAFSPNNDSNNDVFLVRSNFVKQMDFRVYDRWGEELFVSNDIDMGWDGTFQGSELAPDVYPYCLIVTCSNGAEYKKIGNVTLIR